MALRYGFVGLGIMGSRMAANLVREGFDVTVWNRNQAKCEPLVSMGARQGKSPADLAATCDVTIGMVSDPEAAHQVCFGPDGIAEGIGDGRGYVDMSTVDDETARTIGAEITSRGGRFLEAPVSGTKKPAENGTLIILAGGDRSLYDEMVPAFEIMGKKHLFLGDLGQGARMKLVVNMILGGMMALFSEGLSLGQKAGLDAEQLLDVLDSGALSNPMFRGKGALILKEDYTPNFPLKHAQKDLRLALLLGDKLGQSLHSAAAANESFKDARAVGFGDEDLAAVYKLISRQGK